MNLTETIKAAEELGNWIHQNTNDIQIPNKERERIATSIFQHSLDLGDAVILLINRNLIGPAFALARPHFDSYVCGIWLLKKAANEEIERYKNGIYPKIQTMLKKIDDSPESGGAWIKSNAVNNLQSFHALTHAGIEHVIRRNSDNGAVEPCYPEEEIVRILQHTMEIQIGITAHIIELIQDENKIDGLYEKANKFRSKP